MDALYTPLEMMAALGNKVHGPLHQGRRCYSLDTLVRFRICGVLLRAGAPTRVAYSLAARAMMSGVVAGPRGVVVRTDMVRTQMVARLQRLGCGMGRRLH